MHRLLADIIEIVGDATSQRNLLAEFLDAKEADKSVTIYKLKWSEVAELKMQAAHEREALVADALDIEEVSNI